MSTTQKGGFDLGSTKNVTEREDEGQWFHVRDEAGEKMYFEVEGVEKPVRIKVAGSYSKRYRRTAEAQRERMLKKRRVQLTGDQLEENTRELVVACTLAWEGFVAQGKTFELTKEAATALYKQAPWVQEQAAEAIEDHESFSKSSSQS